MPLRMRRGITLMATAATLLLTGCTVAGTVEVRSSDEVVVDLTFRNDSLTDYRCEPEFVRDISLTAEVRTDDQGEALCAVRGVVHPERLRQFLNVTHAGEFLAVSVNPLGVAPGGEQSAEVSRSSIGGLDVTVRFPGQVLTTTGEADGNSARFRDPKQLVRPYGLAAEALNHAGPSWSVVGPLAGCLVGVAGTLLWLTARRRRHSLADSPADALPDQTEGADPEEISESVAAAPDALADSRPDGPGGAQREPARVERPDDRAGPLSARRRPDDSVWAPPVDP